MKKRSDADFIHPSETAYDKAIRRMEEREAYILNSSTMQMAASVRGHTDGAPLCAGKGRGL